MAERASINFEGSWWEQITGPIFKKEIQVTGRQRRWYVLRCGYMGLLLTLFIFTWLTYISFGIGTTLTSAKLSQASRHITTSIVWFQFITMQLLAIGMISSAISEEARQQTLGVLWTTPITGLQFVFGKLSSRLSQLLTLLLASLPVLAMIRVYGGVDWRFMLHSTSLTLSTTLFVSTLTLWLASRVKKPHKVMPLSAIILGVVYGLGGILAFRILLEWTNSSEVLRLLSYVNPYILQFNLSVQALSPGLGIGNAPLLTHIIIMVSLSCLFFMAATLQLRSRAIEFAYNAPKAKRGTRRFRRQQKALTESEQRDIIPVKGNPIIWKGMLATRHQRKARILFYLTLSLSLIGYLFSLSAIFRGKMNNFYLSFYYLFSLLLNVVTYLRLATIPASHIAREKEGRTLPILLTSDFQPCDLMRHYATIAFRRNLPLLIFMSIMSIIPSLISVYFNGQHFTNQAITYSSLVTLSITCAILSGLGTALLFYQFYRGHGLRIKLKYLMYGIVSLVIILIVCSIIFKQSMGPSQYLLLTPFTLFATIYLYQAIGLYCGSRSRSTTQAIVTAVGASLVLQFTGYVFYSLAMGLIFRLLNNMFSMATSIFPYSYTIILTLTLIAKCLIATHLQNKAEVWIKKDLFANA